MIGDWVRYTDPKPFRIEQIDGVEDRVYGDDGFYVDTADLQSIPLTAEILEDNGFSKHDFEHIEGQHKWSWWRDTGTLVSLWCRELNDDPVDGWMIRIESPYATCCRGVESVHDLQHALRLCGIEKEIEL